MRCILRAVGRALDGAEGDPLHVRAQNAVDDPLEKHLVVRLFQRGKQAEQIAVLVVDDGRFRGVRLAELFKPAAIVRGHGGHDLFGARTGGEQMYGIGRTDEQLSRFHDVLPAVQPYGFFPADGIEKFRGAMKMRAADIVRSGKEGGFVPLRFKKHDTPE